MIAAKSQIFFHTFSLNALSAVGEPKLWNQLCIALIARYYAFQPIKIYYPNPIYSIVIFFN